MSRDWTREEALLLRAALVPGPAGEEAYRAWRRTADVQTLDHAEFRVLPLLGRHLDGDPDDPLAVQIRRILRFAWLRSQLLIQRTATRVGVLRDAGIPVMLSKGAAVLEHTGWEVQLRPMDDLDVIVPRERAEDAARALLAADMHQASLPHDPAQTIIYDQVHALDFRDTAGAVLDLHWHVLHGSLHRGADAEFWERSQPATLGAVPVRVLRREDTLLQVVAHGAELNAQHLLRWAADAALLLRDGPAMDWPLVGATARRHRIAGPVAAALARLAAVAPEFVPATLPAELRAPRHPWLPRARDAAPNLTEFVRRSVPPGRLPRPGHVLAYTTEVAGVARARELPEQAARVLTGGRRPRSGRTAGTPGAVAVPFEVGFHAGAPGTDLLGAGWWAPDGHGAWSRGRHAVVRAGLDVPAGTPLRVHLALVPLLSPRRRELTVDVYAGGRRAASWRFTGEALAEAERSLLVRAPAGPLELRLVTRGRRMSPERAGLLADQRPLGVALRRMRVEPAAGAATGSGRHGEHRRARRLPRAA